jgi:hypothetical protein
MRIPPATAGPHSVEDLHPGEDMPAHRHPGRAPRGGHRDPHAPGRAPAGLRLAALCLALLAGLVPRAGAFYDDASLRAIGFSAERARATGAPLVLLAHQTVCDFVAFGPRVRDEHWVWFIGDPDAPACRAVREVEILLDVKYEFPFIDHCRIFRGADTLVVDPRGWSIDPVRGWPPETGGAWRGAHGRLPELKAGDIVDFAYRVENRWSTERLPSAWEAIPIRHPDAPTFERQIICSYNSVLKGRVHVVGEERNPVRHFGVSPPRIELLTGDLPPGPATPGTSPGSPRVLFTASSDWNDVRQTLAHSCNATIVAADRLLEATGDSISQCHRGSRERLGAVLDYAERHWRRVPLPLSATSYYPGDAGEMLRQHAAGPLERAALTAGLARAAHLQAALFLARGDEEPFLPGFALPQQFDHAALRVELTEEQTALLIDPWQSKLEDALRTPGDWTLFLGIARPWEGFYAKDAAGALVRTKIE